MLEYIIVSVQSNLLHLSHTIGLSTIRLDDMVAHTLSNGMTCMFHSFNI